MILVSFFLVTLLHEKGAEHQGMGVFRHREESLPELPERAVGLPAELLGGQQVSQRSGEGAVAQLAVDV